MVLVKPPQILEPLIMYTRLFLTRIAKISCLFLIILIFIQRACPISITIRYEMRTWCALLVLLFFCLAAASSYGHITTPRGNVIRSRVVVLSRTVVADRVDIAVRAKYWYYLPDARLCYLAHTNSKEGCLFLIMYKNRVGTFLAIVNWLDQGQTITINTFVRLGDGIEDASQIDAPITVRPFVVSLDLGYGQYLVPQDTQHHRYTFSESWARSKWFSSYSQEQEVYRRCQDVERYVRKQYWYYLPDAVTLDVSRSNAKEQCYCVFHFVNRVGLWEAIARWDYPHNCPRVNTFVRLGDGYEPQHVEKCHIFPSVTTPWHY